MEKKLDTKDLAFIATAMLAGASLALDICDVVIPSSNNTVTKLAKKGLAVFTGAWIGAKTYYRVELLCDAYMNRIKESNETEESVENDG